jgi:hypothetical protein
MSAWHEPPHLPGTEITGRPGGLRPSAAVPAIPLTRDYLPEVADLRVGPSTAGYHFAAQSHAFQAPLRLTCQD